MKKYKKPLLIGLLALDLAITVFLFVISIILIVVLFQSNKDVNVAISKTSGLIQFLLKNPLIYGIFFVIPLFIILAANIIGLVIYVRKTSKKEPAKLEDLSEEQKEALRQELLKDLQGGGEEKKE